MDVGVQGGEPIAEASGTCNPSRHNYRDLEEEETPQQRLERQKNALLTMISVRELKALLGEMEGRIPTATIKEERQPLKRNQPRGVRRNPERVQAGVNSTKRRTAALKGQQQQLLAQRVTTFCFDRLEFGEFKLTAPDERCAVVPGTNWVKVDAAQRIIIYQFIIARVNSQTPYNVTVHVPFSSIAAIFCGFPEIIVKLNQPAIQASCYQTFGTSYQIVNEMDVTEGQLARADVHKMALRRSTGNSFQEVLLAADLSLFSSILSNGNHLSASSSLYSNYVYNHPHGLLSDYGPSLQHSSYLGGLTPMAINSSVLPHLTYSAPMMEVGAGGRQLGEGQTEGDVQLAQMHPMQMKLPINDRQANEFNGMFENGERLKGNEQNGRESRNERMKGLPPLELSPANSAYISPLINSPYTGRAVISKEGESDVPSRSIPRSTPTLSSSLYALSGSPIFPPSNSPTTSSSLLPTSSVPPYSLSNLTPMTTSSRLPSSYPFPPPSLMTPSPLLPLSPFFSFSSITTPTSIASPGFWNATLGSLRMEEFDSIQTDFHDEKIEDSSGDLQHDGDAHQKDPFDDLSMIAKDETKEEVDNNSLIDPLNDDVLVDLDDERAKYTPSEYSFSSLSNYKTH